MKRTTMVSRIKKEIAESPLGKRRQAKLVAMVDELGSIYDKMWTSAMMSLYIAQDGVFQAVSPLAASVTGYEPDALIGTKTEALIHPEDLAKARRDASDMLHGRRSAPYEFRIVTRQKEVRWVMETVAGLLFNGRPAVLGNFMDISGQKTVESNLEESKNLYRAIFETTGTATIIIEADMTISLINSEFEKMTGYSRQEWEGKKKWSEYIPKKDLLWMKKTHQLRRIDANAAPRNFEHEMIDSRGRIRNMYLTADIIPGTTKSVVSFMDITDWKEAEKGLKQREQELRAKSKNLKELNTALRVLLKQREKDREELEQKVLSNVKKFVLPYIEDIRQSRIDARAMAYVDIIQSNLKDIIAPFSRKLSAKFANLTPKEIQIANLIREGKTSKEIASILNVSKSAIDIHRYRLRNKLGLNNKKTNLRTHLTNFL